MNYLVIKDLIERKTLKQFKAGDVYPCFDPARADFLIEKGYIVSSIALVLYNYSKSIENSIYTVGYFLEYIKDFGLIEKYFQSVYGKDNNILFDLSKYYYCLPFLIF